MKLTSLQRFVKYWTYPLRQMTEKQRQFAWMLLGWVVCVAVLAGGR